MQSRKSVVRGQSASPASQPSSNVPHRNCRLVKPPSQVPASQPSAQPAPKVRPCVVRLVRLSSQAPSLARRPAMMQADPTPAVQRYHPYSDGNQRPGQSAMVRQLPNYQRDADGRVVEHQLSHLPQLSVRIVDRNVACDGLPSAEPPSFLEPKQPSLLQRRFAAASTSLLPRQQRSAVTWPRAFAYPPMPTEMMSSQIRHMRSSYVPLQDVTMVPVRANADSTSTQAVGEEEVEE